MSSKPIFALKGRRVWVAGHSGMVGSALVRRLAREDCEIVDAAHHQLDLTRQSDVRAWVADRRPDAVFLAAARVGGIVANDTRPIPFLYDNILIAANVLEAAARAGVAKLLYLGSSCIYPRLAPQPIVEEALLTGPLEPTNEAYAIAKIAGLKLAQAYRRQDGHDFISAMPTNLYGPGDNFDLASSHVLPALMRKAHEAKHAGAAEMTVWGSGKPRREFLHVDDCADALVFLMTHYSDEGHINVGCGEDQTITALAQEVAGAVGFKGAFRYDASKPDGMPSKLLDISRLRSLGWAPTIPLSEGLATTYEWFLRNVSDLRSVA